MQPRHALGCVLHLYRISSLPAIFMIKYLVMRTLLVAPIAIAISWGFSMQDAPPGTAPWHIIRRPQEQSSQRNLGHPAGEHRGSHATLFVATMMSAKQAQQESRSNGSEGSSNPDHPWGLSEKIGAVAIIVGFLQFLALVATVWVMISNGRRQLRAYVLPHETSIVDGTTIMPPQPARANVPGVGMLIKNCGQTHAYKVISWAKIAVIFVGEENTALGLPPIEERFSNTLGAGSALNKGLWFDRPLTSNEITDIAKG